RRTYAGRRALELTRRAQAETVGGIVWVRLGGGHHRDQILPARKASRYAELHRLADGRRRASFLSSAVHPRYAAGRLEPGVCGDACLYGRNRDGERLRTLDRRVALAGRGDRGVQHAC